MTPPVFIRLWRAIRIALVTSLSLLALVVVGELGRMAAMLHRVHPIAAWVFVAAALLGLSILALVLANRWLSAHVITPPEGPEDGASSHRDLVTCNRFMIARLKVLADNPLFTPEQQKHLRQTAYQIDEQLGHHPMRDDLIRGIERTRADTLAPAHAILRARAEEFARERMRRVVQDDIEPPFPTHRLVSIYGHQFMMLTRIIDLYSPGAGLFEYFHIIRDVWGVIYSGRFLKLGQTLFAGVYANSPPLGHTAATLGSALTTVWMTRVLSRACMLRCEETRAWSSARAAQDLDACMLDLLADSKECLLQDVLPLLKLTLRHHAPAGVSDVTAFSSAAVEGLARALDAAVKAHKAQPSAVIAARRTFAGEEAAALPAPIEEPHTHGRRARRSRNRHGLFRVFYVFGQRLKYSARRPR